MKQIKSEISEGAGERVCVMQCVILGIHLTHVNMMQRTYEKNSVCADSSTFA